MGIRGKDTHGIQFASEVSVDEKREGISDQVQRNKRTKHSDIDEERPMLLVVNRFQASLSLTSMSNEHLLVTDTVALNALVDLSSHLLTIASPPFSVEQSSGTDLVERMTRHIDFRSDENGSDKERTAYRRLTPGRHVDCRERRC